MRFTIEEMRAMIARHKRLDHIFALLGILCLLVGILTLVVLFAQLLLQGMERITPQFFTSFPSRIAENAGILSAWVGTMAVMLVTALTAVPLGVAAAVYLEEYAPKNWLTAIIEINVTNLAGVPSIVYGLLALGLFVYKFGFGQSILSAGLTLALLILPVVIVATREALADGLRACAPLFIGWGPDRHDHRPFPCNRRDRAYHYHRRAHVYRLFASFTDYRNVSLHFI